MEFKALVTGRFSPRRFAPDPIDPAVVREIFATARLAHSNWNEQPWRFLLAPRGAGESRARLERCLFAGNQWARESWLLGAAFAKSRLAFSGDPNACADFDLGAACMLVALRAFELGVHNRFMAGFDREGARQLCPPDHHPVVMFAMGCAAADATPLPDRERHPVDTYLYREEWGSPW